ncbi:hypothetical protein AAFF_G00117780 [Aldrovandia affinis]|uniref:Uncharacterized protein n=1 Tax=Aldrovandia affinis TaxID=143900 RepID=A0AAD7WX40_9TELE|nr:hypothetical protein AAFF_G00117780 [Aldrovandia affinis]
MDGRSIQDERRSATGSRSTHASRSSTTSAVAAAQPKAEAAQPLKEKARLQGVEAQLQAEAASLDAVLDALHIEKEAAAATAEAEVLEAAAEAKEYRSDACSPTPPQSIERRTNKYVQKQARICTDDSSFPNLEPWHKNMESLSPAQHEVTQVNHSCYADVDSFLAIDEWPHEGGFAALLKRPVPQSAAHKHLESTRAKDLHFKEEPSSKVKAGNSS